VTAPTVSDFPPYGSTFQGNVQVPLLDQNNQVVGFLQSAAHRPLCQTSADCDDLNPCTSDSCQPSSGICKHVPLPDSDGDGICDPQDNCPNVANGGQGTLVFPIYPEMIVFPTKTQICWTTPSAVHVVVGPLAGVSTYQVLGQSHDPSETCRSAVDPIPNGGLYYLIERDCPAASFQSSLGMEPARDDLLP
jgi:hypothetical protein